MAETTPTAPEILTCTVHPTVETTLRCNKCGRPMCIKCARRTPVGYRCKECVSNQQAIFFNAQPLDPVIQLVVATLLSAVAGGLIGVLGGALGYFMLFLITIPASGFAGGLIADLAHRAVGKRYGKYGWLVVAAGVVLGAAMVGVLPALLSMLGGGTRLIGVIVYAVVAAGAAIARLRMGK